MLTEQQYSALRDWPTALGGGEQGADIMVSQILRILQLPFNPNVRPPHADIRAGD